MTTRIFLAYIFSLSNNIYTKTMSTKTMNLKTRNKE